MWAEQKISVIIPVYNTGRFVKEAIDSVRNQTYENLEIIAVDDGSSDNAGQICDEIASGDARVKVIHQANAGVSAARNKGLDNATGDYIAFLDSDDTYVIDALEYLKSVLEKENGDFIYGRMLRMNEFGVFEKVNQSYGEDYEVLTREEFWKSKKNLTGKAVVYVKLYKASIFKTVRFKEGYIHEDEGILWEIVSQCDRIISSDRTIANALFVVFIQIIPP